jgi:peroxiredoxin Q/BCP
LVSPLDESRLLQTGDIAPDFVGQALIGDRQVELALSGPELVGKKIILAFYPKDSTPGCTREMCDFSAQIKEFAGAGWQIIGVSCDSIDSHRRFAAKNGLQQILIADTGGNIGRKYGVMANGKATASRVLYLIDAERIVQHVHQGMPDMQALLQIASLI